MYPHIPQYLRGSQNSNTKGNKSSGFSIPNYDKINKAEQTINSIGDIGIVKKLDILETIMQASKVFYIDSNKQYVILHSKYYQQLQDIAKSASKTIEHLKQQKISSSNSNQILFGMGRTQQNQINKLRQENNKISLELKNIKQSYRMLQESYEKQDENIQMIHNQFQLIKRKNQELKRQCDEKQKIIGIKYQRRSNISTQTEYQNNFMEVQNQQIEDPQNKQRHFEEERTKIRNMNEEQLEILRLKDKFIKIIGDMENTLRTKITELEQNMVNLQEFEQENKKLKQEIAVFKSQMQEMHQKEEMSSIWRFQIKDFLKKVDDQASEEKSLNPIIQENGSEDVEQEIQNGSESNNDFANRQKIKMLQNKVLELNQEKIERNKKLLQIQKILHVDQSQVPEESIVNKMVTLSSKVKSTIKYLLDDI